MKRKAISPVEYVERDQERVYLKKKTPQDISIKTIHARSDTHDWEEYLSTISFQMQPANHATKLRLAIELSTWVRENEKAYTLSQFYTMKGIPHDVYYQWASDCLELREANRLALEIMGDRREIGALENRLNSMIARFILPQYKREWREQEVFRATLQRESGESRGMLTVVLDSVEESDLVPKLEDKDAIRALERS
jgi:hypothetical protein